MSWSGSGRLGWASCFLPILPGLRYSQLKLNISTHRTAALQTPPLLYPLPCDQLSRSRQ